jgi:hypothetical protein
MSVPEELREEDERVRALPDGLLQRLRADPARAPEHVALAAAERHAPAAAEWVADKRARFAADGPMLAGMAKKRHASLARFGGAAAGVGGFVTIVPDLAALAWIQSRLVFFIAASYGYDPHDPMRPAELLVLQELFPDVTAARAALDGAGDSVASTWIDARMSRDEALATRLAKMVGKRAAKRVVTRLIPGVAIAFNAIGNERDTRALADRAIRFYAG